jgi:hypothetical protein
MKLTIGMVAVAMMMGTGWAQHASAVKGAPVAQPKPTAASTQATATKPAPAPAKPAATPVKAASVPVKPAPVDQKHPVARALPMMPATSTQAAKPESSAQGETATAHPEVPVVGGSDDTSKSDAEDKKYSMTGKRDPFLSPVVSRQSGSGCSTGKKCLDIEAIALHGVVRSDNGMIAVVTNGLNKAYFLRENDPVFNGYVVKITGDSVVFKETFQDKLGKPFTRDVVKKITTPAV